MSFFALAHVFQIALEDAALDVVKYVTGLIDLFRADVEKRVKGVT